MPVQKQFLSRKSFLPPLLVVPSNVLSRSGAFHSGGLGKDKFSRLTALVRDKSGNQLYFYRTTDKTFWERIHIPEDPLTWPTNPIYIGISKSDFDK